MNSKQAKRMRKVAKLIHAKYVAALRNREMVEIPSERMIYQQLKRRYVRPTY
jgi:hypothetical protein